MERKTVVGTGGELLVHQLVAQGVDYVFTNTGSAEAGFFNGLLAVPGVQPILLLMEPLVLSAADGYGKIADKPAFVNVHLAAGTRQGSGQLQNAFFDGTPMVVTAAMRDTGSFSDHVTLGSSGGFSQMGAVEDITKRRWEVWDARGVPTVTRRAFQEAMTLPTAPVYVAYTSQALDTPGVEATIQPGAAPVMGRLPDEGVLRTIFDALLNAENPLLVCGIDIRYAHAEREIVELAERLALPVATGTFDYGSFPVHHPNYIGSVDTLSEEPYDVVCCVGYRQSGRGGPVDLPDDGDGFFYRELASFGHHLLQRDAGNKIHGDEVRSLVLADIEDSNHILVRDLLREQHLLLEAFHHHGSCSQMRMYCLYGNNPRETPVEGLENGSHAARAKRVDDFVPPAEDSAGGWSMRLL